MKRQPLLDPGQPESRLMAAARPLFDLINGQVSPVFLDPLVADVDEGLELVRATPRAVIRAEFDRVLAGSASPVPSWVRNLADGDRAEREIVVAALRACHDLFVAPRRAEFDRTVARDIAARMPALRSAGGAAVLANLHPQLRLQDNTLMVVHPRDQTMRMHGQCLELIPSPTWSGPPMLTWAWHQPDRWMLIYATAPLATVTPDAVVQLIGAIRAALLRQLWQPSTTGELATRLHISAASVSQHTTVLRNSGLIDSCRTGRTVHHVLAALGEALLKGRSAGPNSAS